MKLMIRCAELCGRNEKTYNIMVGKCEWKRLFGKPSSICGDNIKMDLK
jgi:hypothetical protein